MVRVLVDRSRIERSQTVDEARLVDDLRGSPAFSGFVGIIRFNDFWRVKEQCRSGVGGQREAVAFGWECGVNGSESGGGGFAR